MRPRPRRRCCPRHRPLPPPLHGPEFGSYAAGEVALAAHRPVRGARSRRRPRSARRRSSPAARTTPSRCRSSTSPTRSTSGCSSRRWTASAERIAHAVGVVTELVLAERGPAPVLASLARAGTPVGILMRRWARFAHGLDLPHYALSIVRGRGIDQRGAALPRRAPRPARRRVRRRLDRQGRDRPRARRRAWPATPVRPAARGARRPRALRDDVRHPRRLPHPVRVPELDRLRAGLAHRAQPARPRARAVPRREVLPRAGRRRRLERGSSTRSARGSPTSPRRVARDWPARAAPATGRRPGPAGPRSRRSARSTASTTSTWSSPGWARRPGCCCAGCRGWCWSGPTRVPTSPTSGCWPSSAACRSARSPGWRTAASG